jgi:hypothetical protein
LLCRSQNQNCQQRTRSQLGPASGPSVSDGDALVYIKTTL